VNNIEIMPVISYIGKIGYAYCKRKQVDHKEFIWHYNNREYSSYWQKFPFRFIIECRQPQVAIEEIFYVFNKIKNIEPDKFHEFHKGNPYYFLGLAYFQIRDYESAVYFINAAVKEDLELKPPNNPSPATWFIELNSWSKRQAGRDLVKQASHEMRGLVRSYNIIILKEGKKNTFSMKLLRDKMLRKAISIANPKYQTIATALISYVLEFNIRFNAIKILDSLESIEPFALHLLKGCVLLESILKENPRLNHRIKSTDDLNKWVINKSSDLGISKNLKMKTKNLQSVIDDIPKGRLTLEDSFSLSCRIRNTISHSLEWKISISEINYRKLYEAIGISCLHAINCLYTGER
jgi:hypothetical protein